GGGGEGGPGAGPRDERPSLAARRRRAARSRERRREAVDREPPQLVVRPLEARGVRLDAAAFDPHGREDCGRELTLQGARPLPASGDPGFQSAARGLVERGELAGAAVAREPEVAVRRVAAEGERALGQEGEDLRARDSEERPHDAVLAAFAGTGEPRDASAPAQREHVRLEDVVALVRGGD